MVRERASQLDIAAIDFCDCSAALACPMNESTDTSLVGQERSNQLIGEARLRFGDVAGSIGDFEQVCLASAVLADEYVDAWRKFDIDALKCGEAFELNSRKAHGASVRLLLLKELAMLGMVTKSGQNGFLMKSALGVGLSDQESPRRIRPFLHFGTRLLLDSNLHTNAFLCISNFSFLARCCKPTSTLGRCIRGVWGG